MGVAISAYKGLVKIDCELNKDTYPVDEKILDAVEDGEYIQPYKNPDFPGRADDIKERAVYSYVDNDSFFSASYGYYNRLRNQLAEIAGYQLREYEQEFGGKKESYCVDCWNGKTGPFSELINFSDCEGIFGPAISAKLVKDFDSFQEKADATKDERFLDFYNSMKSAFEMASSSGLVDFH